MKNLSVLLVTILFVLSSSLKSQDGYFADFGYKVGRTNLSYAYATFLVKPNTNTSHKRFELHPDAFLNTNWTFRFGNNSESTFYRIDFGGLSYLMFEAIRDQSKVESRIKSKYRKYNDLVQERPELKDMAPLESEYNSRTIHPLSGAMDMKFFEFEMAFGAESAKVGPYFAFGSIGANGRNNGASISNLINKWGVTTFNTGYSEVGIKAFGFHSSGSPFEAELYIGRLRTQHKSSFEKRKGYS